MQGYRRRLRTRAQPDLVGIRQIIVSQVQMVMRTVEMADLVLAQHVPWDQRLGLRMIQAYCLHRIRTLLAHLPADMLAEVLAESDKMTGRVTGFSQN